MSRGYEPRFDLDVALGEANEQRAWVLFGGLLSDSSRLRVEVKYTSYPDEWFYVETEHNPRHHGWKPSGITVTEADLWAVPVADTGCWMIVPVVLIKAMIKDLFGRPKEETDGDCPTRGRLLRFGAVLQYAHQHPQIWDPITGMQS